MDVTHSQRPRSNLRPIENRLAFKGVVLDSESKAVRNITATEASTMVELAGTLLRAGDRRGAVACARKCEATCHVQAAQIYLSLGMKGRAAEQFAMDPESREMAAELYLVLATTHHSRIMYVRAMNLYREIGKIGKADNIDRLLRVMDGRKDEKTVAEA